MKQEMISLSPAALFGIFAAGALLDSSLYSSGEAVPRLITATALLAYGWQDAREGWRAGIWKRGWFRWNFESGPQV